MALTPGHKVPVLDPAHDTVNQVEHYSHPQELHVFSAFTVRQCAGAYDEVKAVYAPYQTTLPQGIIVSGDNGTCYEKTAATATADISPSADTYSALGQGVNWQINSPGNNILLPLGL